MRSTAILLYVVMACTLMSGRLFAGQVVTEDTRQWARDALNQEKALNTVSTPNTLAVLYFDNHTENSDFDLLRKGLALMLMTDLSKVEAIKVVERVKVQAIVEELGYQTSGLTTPEAAARMGWLMGAEFLVGGDIAKQEGDKFRLSSNLLNVPIKEIFGRPEITGRLLDDLFDMEKKLLFYIVKLLKIELTEEQKQDLKKPLTTDVQAFLYFVQGVEESDKGNYDKAETLYKKAVARDPELTPAKEASTELLNLGMIKPKLNRREILKAQKERTSLTDKLVLGYPVKRRRLPQNMTPTCEVQIEWERVP